MAAGSWERRRQREEAGSRRGGLLWVYSLVLSANACGLPCPGLTAGATAASGTENASAALPRHALASLGCARCSPREAQAEAAPSDGRNGRSWPGCRTSASQTSLQKLCLGGVILRGHLSLRLFLWALRPAATSDPESRACVVHGTWERVGTVVTIVGPAIQRLLAQPRAGAAGGALGEWAAKGLCSSAPRGRGELDSAACHTSAAFPEPVGAAGSCRSWARPLLFSGTLL